MPKVLLKDIFVEIRHSLGRFCSILAIVALGVAFFAGIKASAPDMKYSADQYFDEYNLQDIQVYSTLGLTKEDVEAIRKLSGVDDVQPVFSMDTLAYKDSSELVIKVFSLPDPQNINTVRLIEGRMPEAENECLIEAPSVTNSLYESFGIGDVISLQSGTSEPLEDDLVNTSYTIVGTCYTPYYLSYEKGTSSIGSGEVSTFIFVPDSNIKADYYTEIDVSVDGAKAVNTYSDEYFDIVDKIVDEIEAIAGDQVEIRIASQQQKVDDARAELTTEVSKAQKKLDDARAEIEDGEAEIAENEAKLTDAKTQIDEGQAEISANEITLADVKSQLDAGWQELNSSRTTLLDAASQLEEGWQELNANKVTLADALRQIREGQLEIAQNEVRLTSAQKEIDDGWSEVRENEAVLADARDQLDAGWKELADSEEQLRDAKQQLDDGWSQYYAGKEQVDDGIRQLESYINQILVNKDQLDTLNARLDTLKEQLSQLDQEIPALKENGIEMQQVIDTISSLQARLEELKNQEDDPLITVDQLEAVRQEILRIEEEIKAMPGYDAASAQLQDILQKLEDLYNEQKDVLDQYEELKDFIASIEEGIENLSTLRAQLNQLLDAKAQLEESYEQLSAAQKQYDEGYAQYLEGKETLESKEQEYQDGLAQLNAARAQLEDAQKEVDDGWAQIRDARAQLEDARKQYADGESQLKAGEATLLSSQKEYEDGLAQYNSGLATLESSQASYDSGVAQLEAAKATLSEYMAEYLDGLSQISDAKEQLAEGKSEYEDGVAQLKEEKEKGEKEIDEAQKQIDVLSGEWIVLDRNSHYSYRDYGACADRMDGIASVFPVFFFLVAALVCMTTMTRMVDEQRTEIGTLKALGYSKLQIAAKYLIYASLASIAGSIIGCAVGMFVFPYIIFYAWNTMYNLPVIHFQFQPGLMVMASLSVTGIVLLATIYSIYRELMEVPSQLMRPKAGTAGKKILLERIPWLWNRVPFLHKVTLRNIFRYKKRFLMTVIGISGCSALLVAGFGINDSISDIVSLQYVQIYHYDASMTVDAEDEEEIARQIQATPGVEEIFEEQTVNATLDIDDKEQSATIHVIDDPQAFEEFTTLRSIADKSKEYEVSGTGAYINEKMAQKMGLSEGDTFEMELPGDETIQVQVAGIYENYVGHHIYVSQEQFDQWHVDPDDVTQTFLLKDTETEEAFEKELGSDLMALDGAKSVTFYSSLQENFLNMIGSIKMIVVVLVISAAALAFVVLYNLSNVNISERMREIATIKVLGFTEKEVNAYVNRESIVLALIGSIVGMLIGIYLHQLIMSLAELDDVMFGRTISWSSYLISFILTMVFAFAVNWVMKFKLRKIEMVESLKAVE